MTDTLDKHLKRELDQLREEFIKMYPKYDDSFKRSTLKFMGERLHDEYWETWRIFRKVSEVHDNKFNITHIQRIRQEAEDVALVALMIMWRCNDYLLKKYDPVHRTEFE